MSLGITLPERQPGQRVGALAALAGGPIFLPGTLLHPAPDAEGIVRVGETYGL